MKRWLWFLTKEVRTPFVYRALDGRLHASPKHITDPRLKGLGVEVVFTPYMPSHRTERRWLWEK